MERNTLEKDIPRGTELAFQRLRKFQEPESMMMSLAPDALADHRGEVGNCPLTHPDSKLSRKQFPENYFAES